VDAIEGTEVKRKMANGFESLVQEWRDRYPETSDYFPESDIDFLDTLLARGEITSSLYGLLVSRLERPEEPLTLTTEVWKEVREEVGDTLFDKIGPWFKLSFNEAMMSFWRFVAEHIDTVLIPYDKLGQVEWDSTIRNMAGLINKVIEVVKPILERSWEAVKGKLEDGGRNVFGYCERMFEVGHDVGPEDVSDIATRLYTFAFGAGMGAHGIAVGTEMLQPLKHLGVHHTAALVGSFSGFGRITSAIIGPLMSRVLGTLQTYRVQAMYRPKIPDEKLLIEFRSKREIDKSEFDDAMAYQGYSNKWIDIIERWQWKDPRMFEIIRLADIGLQQGSPPSAEMGWLRRFGVTGDKLKDWWLYRKFMRAGYEDCDIPVMVRFIHRREVAFALTYVRTAVRRNYRWGYLSDSDLNKWLDHLQLPDEARDWIKWAGELDRDYFYRQNLVMHYKTAFRQGLIDDDELLVSLLSIGLPARESSLMTRTEVVRRTPKVSRPTSAATKKVASDIQKKYVTLYRDQFRKGLITEDLYLNSLLAIGLDPGLAEVTVELELTKMVPKPTAL